MQPPGPDLQPYLGFLWGPADLFGDQLIPTVQIPYNHTSHPYCEDVPTIPKAYMFFLEDMCTLC